MAQHYFFLCTFLIFSLFIHGIAAMDYEVRNYVSTTPGGTRFTNEIGIPYTKEIMCITNDFIWTTVLQQNNLSDRKPVEIVNLFIVELDGYAGVTWGNNNINVSSIFIQGYEGDDLVKEFTSLMYHEMTHVFQWDGEGQTPNGLIEGVADYTQLVANYAHPGFVNSGVGNRWDQGYDVTARFLEYCDGIVPGFVAKLNAMMRFSYDVKYFEDLTGKPVEQLWQEYKAEYGH